MHPTFKRALTAATAQLLRPLVRMLLRQSVPFAAFEELAKRVYVEVANEEFGLAGRKPTISRASILTGLTRKEVQRLTDETRPAADDDAQQYNRAARVLTAWVREPRYHDDSGQPRPLPTEGDFSFAALVKAHSGDMPVRAVLDELLRVGAVRRTEDGHIELRQRAYVPQQDTLQKLAILGVDVAGLIDTIDHNVERGARDPRFQRKVMYHRVPAAVAEEFRRRSAEQAQQLLERLDNWLAEQPAADPDLHGDDRPASVGLGIYYFEHPTALTDSDSRGST